ncbi:MAG: DUF2089 domain-containing protein [Anaerolineae bacterium]|nr:DUF2089 domain-containing protein [Anaerolineae bacterium]
MARTMLTRCPNCGGRLEATRLECRDCETVILARYEPCALGNLSPESLRFVELFVRRRGNLKEMERELGESYWTLRTRLSEVIQEMGFDEAEGAPTPEEVAARRREVLDQLEAGEIGAKEAATLLSSLASERDRS